MKISIYTIKELTTIIIGDTRLSPRRTRADLVDFFKQHINDFLDVEPGVTRHTFVNNQLQKLNDTPIIKTIIEAACDPRYYLASGCNVIEVVNKMNEYLSYDGLEIVGGDPYYYVRTKGNHDIIRNDFVNKPNIKADHSFIVEQFRKIEEKIKSDDYDGAITNARSMTEAVFGYILTQAKLEVPEHDGDLNKLFKEVKRCLNLDTSSSDLSNTLKQIIVGLTSIITGIAGIGNKMGDRHHRKYTPRKHHAILAAQTANALCQFLISSQEYQKKT